MLHTINCRAQVTPECMDGQSNSAIDPDYRMQDDGTFDRHTNTIVCDACYVALMPLTPSGRALNHELPEAIEKVKAGG